MPEALRRALKTLNELPIKLKRPQCRQIALSIRWVQALLELVEDYQADKHLYSKTLQTS